MDSADHGLQAALQPLYEQDATMISADLKRNLDTLHAELREVFADRLGSLILYGSHARTNGAPPPGPPALPRRVHTLAVVDGVSFADLSACAARAAAWERQNLAVPLLLTLDEFTRSLDALPLEYGEILAHHVLIAGANPFSGVSVRASDLRRGCEVQARSHLIHLREGYVETGGDGVQVAQMIAASAEPFATLLDNVMRLQGVIAGSSDQLAQFVEAAVGLSAATVRQVVALRKGTSLTPAAALSLYPMYLDATQRLWTFVDRWEA